MHRFSEAALREALEKLPTAAQSAFAQSCAIRTLGAGRGDLPQSVRALCLRSLDVAEGAAAGDAKGLELCADLSTQLEEVDVDDERHSTCAHVLRHLTSNGDVENVLWAAELAYNWKDQIAIDGLDFKTFTPEIEKTLLASPDVQNELRSQEEDLQELLSRPNEWRAVVRRAKGGAR
jgi:hypothetical protein